MSFYFVCSLCPSMFIHLAFLYFDILVKKKIGGLRFNSSLPHSTPSGMCYLTATHSSLRILCSIFFFQEEILREWHSLYSKINQNSVSLVCFV